MGIYLNPGNEGFRSALNSQIYVDKTKMLAYTNSVLDSEQRYLCVSRPRRFGKSMAAEMLVAYYDKSCDSSELFRNCAIASDEHFREHLNQYDVIHIDVNSFRGAGKPGESIVPGIQRLVLGELCERYPECMPDSFGTLPAALAEINKANGARFVVVIDEWDAVFREDREDGTESALNNFDEFTMLDADVLAEYVGFTEEEARDLYDRYGMDFEQAKQWYDGYALEKGLHIYNPKSVVDSVRRGRIGNYWTGTETYESLKRYISMNFDGLRDAVAQMLGGACCKVNPAKFQNDLTSFKSRDDILTLLVHLGYLTYDGVSRTVHIPNEEVKTEFVNAIEDAGWDSVMEAINASDRLLAATWRGDEHEVEEGIDTS